MKNTAIIILSIALIIVSLLLIYNGQQSGGNSSIRNKDPTIYINGDIGYEELPNNNVKLQAFTGITFEANHTDQIFAFANDAYNRNPISVVLLLGDGTILYKSNILSPGDLVTEIELSFSLKPGLYRNSVMLYKVYSSTGTVISQCEFPVEIVAR